MIASPLGLAFALHFLLRFVGRARELRGRRVALVPAERLAVGGGRGRAGFARRARSHAFGALELGFLIVLFPAGGPRHPPPLRAPAAGGRLRRADPHAPSARRVIVIAPLASTEIFADMGFGVPRLGVVGTLSFNVILLVAVLRFRLFDRKLSAQTALSGITLAALGGSPT
jgi:hypothetical protein